MNQPIFQQVPDGRFLAIRNWQHRHHEDDALVAVPLTTDEVSRYQAMKARGASDERIFESLFPPPATERVSMSINQLTKPQLLGLLVQLLPTDTPSLRRMTREDLATLTRALCRPRRGCEGFLV
ncbi:MAG: hypothetical protein AAGE01_02390 [Pseudomonadota bacterium]